MNLSDLDYEELAPPEGDPRRCPSHPWVRTSDPFGMHDAPCGECECAMERDERDEPAGSAPPPPTPALPVLDDDIPF